MQSHADALRAAFSEWQRTPTDEAMNAFLIAAKPVILATSERILRYRHAAADDVTSEAMTYLWRHRESCHGDPVAWCRSIARSKALSVIRTERKQPVLPLDIDADLITEVSPLTTDIDYQLLSPTEIGVANLLAEGYSMREVMDELRMSRAALNRSVESIRANINNHAAISHLS